jgi:prepilin-type N-terminal cleavage/methylation domain-containing protein
MEFDEYFIKLNPKPMDFNHSIRRVPSRSPGFSLVELLTVIAIISILMTIGAIGIGNISAGKGVPTAVANAEAIFDEARTIAISKKTRALVLVDVNDPKRPEVYLRRVIVAYENQDAATGDPIEGDWVIANRGTVLPDQVYYSQDLSREDHASGAGDTQTMRMTLSQSDTVKSDFAGDYIAYEFNSEGICTTPGASFVVGTGARPPGAEKPRVTSAAKRDFGGFVIWRNGRTSVFRSPEQIDIPTSLTEF